MQAWPRFLHFGFFLPPLLPLCVLTDRAVNVAAWAVTEAVSFFIIALSSLMSLLFRPEVTVIDSYVVASVGTVFPSMLSSSSRMRAYCACIFSYSNAVYSTAAAKLSSAVVEVDPS